MKAAPWWAPQKPGPAGRSGRPTWPVPAAGPAAVDPQGPRITAAASTGAAFLLDRQSFSRRVQDETLGDAPAASEMMNTVADLGRGRMVLGAIGGEQLLHIRPDAPRGAVNRVRLAGPLACELVSWRDWFVASTRVGELAAYDADSAQQVATPFIPTLEPGAEIDWIVPALHEQDGKQLLVASDGTAHLWLLDLAESPEPHLTALAEATITGGRLKGRLATLENHVFAPAEGGVLQVYALPSLDTLQPVDVGSEVTWGPFQVGGELLLATAAGELVAIDPEGEIAWRQPTQDTPPRGTPLADDDSVLVLGPNGVRRIALQDGSTQNEAPTGEPAAFGPVGLGNRLIVTAHDGTLLVVEKP